MSRRSVIVRDVSLMSSDKVYRSAARMVARRRADGSTRRPVEAETLRRADLTRVVITSHDGRVHIGRLRLCHHHVELWQIIHGIPCRQRFGHDDILACYTYDDEELWDEPTQPAATPLRPPVAGRGRREGGVAMGPLGVRESA